MLLGGRDIHATRKQIERTIHELRQSERRLVCREKRTGKGHPHQPELGSGEASDRAVDLLETYFFETRQAGELLEMSFGREDDIRPVIATALVHEGDAGLKGRGEGVRPRGI